MKKLLLAAFFLLSSLGLHAQTTAVTGNLKTVLGENLGTNTFVRIRLRNYKPNLPRVSGTGTIIQAGKDVSPDSNGLISTTVYDNDFITPNGTFYTLEFYFNGRFTSASSYIITGSSFDFNTATPISSVPTAAVPTFESRVFTHVQASAATTWTITHNFGVREVTLDFYDNSFNRIFPDLVTLTDINTVTAKFVVAQSGRVVVMRAENVNLTSSVSDAVLKVPTTAQSMTGGFDLSSDGSFLPDSLFTKNNDNRRHVTQFAGADLGAKFTACIAAAPAGGTCDGSGFTTVQTIAATVTVSKSINLILPCVDITTSASPAFDFTATADFSTMAGCNKGSTTTGGTTIIAASSGVTPLIRIAGTSGAARVVKIELRDFALTGTDTLDLQTGIFFNFFTDITLDRMQFGLLGQAEDIDAGARIIHTNVSYDRVGTGGTPATAGIRIENRSDPGGVLTTLLEWDYCIWQGDNEAGNNKQGTTIYSEGVEVTVVRLTNSIMDFDATNPDFPIIVFNETQFAFVGGNTIGASTITTANAVVDITGDASNKATNIQLYNNRIVFSNTVPGVRFDWGSNNYLVGGIMRGLGSGTAISITANQAGGSVGPFQMGSLDTPVSNSSATVVTLYQEVPGLDAWRMPEGLALGTGNLATAGLLRAANNVVVFRQRNAGNTLNLPIIFLDSSDDVQVGDANTDTRVMGTLGFGDITPQATGIIGPNNECYWTLDAGAAAVCIAIVDASDILRIGDDADLVSIVLGRSTVPTVAGDLTVNDILFFTETSGDASCGVGDYWFKGNSTTTTIRGCEDGSLFTPSSGAGGGAPANAQYLVLALDGTLTDERNLTAGIGIGDTDGGAGAAYDIFLDLSELTANQTFWTGASATRTITHSLSGATDPVFNFGNNLFNVTNAEIQEGGTDVTKTVSFGTGNCAEFDANGDLVDSAAGCGAGSGDNITVNAVAAVDANFDDSTPAAPANGFNVKWQKDASTPNNISAYFDTTTYASTIVGSGSTITETWNVGATDPVWTVATGVMNLSTGTLQQGGNAVELQSNKDAVSGYAGLDGSSKLTASQGQEVWALADLTDVASTTGSGTVSVLGTNPTLTDVTVNDLITFTETAGDDTCIAGDYWLKGNSSSTKMRGCEDGNLFDVNTTAGATAWSSLTAPTAAMNMVSGTNTELMIWSFESALGATDIGYLLRQQTGNPVAGSVLFNLTAADADILLTRWGNGTDNIEVTQAVVMSANGTGSIVADEIVADTIDDLTDFLGTLCGTNEFLEDQGAAWACTSVTSRWDQLADPTAVTVFNSGAVAELFQLNFTTDYGATDDLVDIEQLTGNPVAGSVLFKLSASDPDILLAQIGGTNGVQVTQAGALTAIGSGSITATLGDSATSFFTTGQIEQARGGTGIDSSALTGVLRVSTGTWTADAGISHLAASSSADLLGVLSNETGTGVAVFGTNPTFTTSIIQSGDAADAGFFKLQNSALIAWEASPAGTDLTLTVNSSEVLVSSAPIQAPSFTGTGNPFIQLPNWTTPTVGDANTGRVVYESATQRLRASLNAVAFSDIALASDNLGLFAPTTSLQLRGVLSDESGTGLALFQTAPTIINPVLDTGVDNDGSGFKHIRVTTGSISPSSSAAVVATWPTTFADANYTVNCSVLQADADTATLQVDHIEAVVAVSVTVRVENEDSGAAKTGTLHCVGIHD